jgi:hypothetical protein
MIKMQKQAQNNNIKYYNKIREKKEKATNKQK